jgi:CheY-like chemotaxis protein
VLINLAINARDAMPDGGTLRISTFNGLEADLGKVKVAVTDSGSGMDADTLSHLFEPFFTTKGAGKGTGLGLATAYGIIKQSFGDITVESSIGGGSTFTISLPIAKTTGSATTIPAQAPAVFTKPAGSKRVLLVEDDDDVRGFASEVLNRAGFEVLPARHGLDGLSVAKANDYAIDLVVTDVVMPEMGGRQMVEQLRRVRPDLRVLYISGYANDAEARRELGSGEAMLLEKPFTARTLREAVESAGTD